MSVTAQGTMTMRFTVAAKTLAVCLAFQAHADVTRAFVCSFPGLSYQSIRPRSQFPRAIPALFGLTARGQ